MLFTLSTQATLGTMTFYYIHINTWVSDYYRKSQKTVLIALCAQVNLSRKVHFFRILFSDLRSSFLRVHSVPEQYQRSLFRGRRLD